MLLGKLSKIIIIIHCVSRSLEVRRNAPLFLIFTNMLIKKKNWGNKGDENAYELFPGFNSLCVSTIVVLIRCMCVCMWYIQLFIKIISLSEVLLLYNKQQFYEKILLLWTVEHPLIFSPVIYKRSNTLYRIHIPVLPGPAPPACMPWSTPYPIAP